MRLLWCCNNRMAEGKNESDKRMVPEKGTGQACSKQNTRIMLTHGSVL